MPKFTERGSLLGSCRDCNKIFQAESVKKLKIMERLHRKLCPNTGRTVDEQKEFYKISAEQFKSSIAYAVSKKTCIRTKEHDTLKNELEKKFATKKVTSSSELIKKMLKHS